MIAHEDSRFTTRNTNLAACLGALRIPLKNVASPKDGKVYNDYIRKIEDSETGNITIYWCFEDRGKEHEARVIESHWAHRDRFEAEFPNHPLVPMRKALEMHGWLTKVWWGNISPQTGPGEVKFVTRDIILASCLLALDYDLLSFEFGKKEFGFGFVGQSTLDAYENYREGNHPISPMRLVLECRKLLIEELKRPDLVTQVHYKIGDPLNGGKEMFITKGGVTEEQLELLMKNFYD